MNCVNCNDVCLRISHCGKATCFEQYLNRAVDSVITPKIEGGVIEFLLKSAHSAAKLVIKGLGHYVRNIMFADLPEAWSVKDFYDSVDYLLNIIDKLPVGDNAILAELGQRHFAALKYVCLTHYDLRSAEVPLEGTPLKVMRVYYPKDIDYSRTKTMYLFHGSHISNWLNILKNGFVSSAEDKRIVSNASVYGHGVYCSKSLNISYGYSSRSCKASDIVIAVCEMSDECSKYEKGDGYCHVIPDSSLLQIRCLIAFKGMPSMEMGEIIKKSLVAFSVQMAKSLNERRLKYEKRRSVEVRRLGDVREVGMELYDYTHKDWTIRISLVDYPIRAPPIWIVGGPCVDSPCIKHGVFYYREFSHWSVFIKLGDLVGRLCDVLDEGHLIGGEYPLGDMSNEISEVLEYREPSF